MMRHVMVIQWMLIGYFFLDEVAALCPFKCDCSDEPSHCPAGVSLVTDDCNCCQVCAKQVGQQCNDYDKICDVHKSSFCDYSTSRNGDRGICIARSGLSCWHDNVKLPSGFMFEPSCKTRCWCMDGVVGCVPLCPHETQVPRSDRCPNARLQSVPDQCCDQWMCDTPSGDVISLSLDKFWDEYVEDRLDDDSSPIKYLPEMGNGVKEGVIYEDDVGITMDDVIDYQMMQGTTFNPKINLESSWNANNILPGDVNAHRHAAKVALKRRKQCQVQSSQWSFCSKTCGLGLSSRISNHNVRCALKRENRLCQIRPCNERRYSPKRGRQCLRQKRARRRIRIKYAGCESVKKTKPRYCGTCKGRGNRCCTPKATRTTQVQFRCPSGTIFSKPVLVVRSCHCHGNCASTTNARETIQSILPKA